MSTITPLTVVQGTYTVPTDQVDEHRGAHLAFVDALIAEGALLAAGRTPDQRGSILIVRAPDGEAATAVLAGDPYLAAGVVTYASAGTFTPGRHVPQLASLLAG